MILQALSDYAERVGLIGDMDVKDRLVHLVLRIDSEGQVFRAAPWNVRTRQVADPKKGTIKEEVGQPLSMPEYPGVNAGGKAHFLADSAEKVLGLLAGTGEPVPDDGKNAAKAFEHYWKRVADAFAETKDSELEAMLKFRGRYLMTDDRRASLAEIAGIRPMGKGEKPTFVAIKPDGTESLEGRTITFQVGATSPHVFVEGSPLRDYWKKQFKRERFVESPTDSTANRGACLVSGEEDVPIAEVHRTLIKGVPGLPPIGGYLVSFDEMTPSLRSYGFEKCWNAPVSEDAAAAYALGLNDILAQKGMRVKIGGAVLAGWAKLAPGAGGADLDREASRAVFDLFDMPTADAIAKFFEAFRTGKFSPAIEGGRYRSLTLAANGGRVVVRRWLDESLAEMVGSVRRWFDDLAIEVIEVPRKSENSGRGKATKEAAPAHSPEPARSPFAIHALAGATARVPSEVLSTTFDALYRAALDYGRYNPLPLLAPALQRLKIAAAERGNGIRFDNQRFALIKLILTRWEDRSMTEVDPISDPAYNCGRILALLDDMQYQAHHREVGADVVARFYGNASTFPANVFSRLLRLEKHHRAKALKNSETRGAALVIGRKMDSVIELLPKIGPGGAPDFPGLLSLRDQGRFAIGFHRQKAETERERKARVDSKKAVNPDAGPDAGRPEFDDQPE